MSLSENTSKIEQLLAAISALPEAGGGDTPATVEQATPSITVSASGLITASATQTAGYVEAGTKSATKQLTTQAAQTITPGTSNKTISSGRYLTGTQTIKGDANLIASNIKEGVTIFNVLGTFAGGSSGGGGGLPEGVKAMSSGEYIAPSDTNTEVLIDHGLGVEPHFLVWYLASDSPVQPTASCALYGVTMRRGTNILRSVNGLSSNGTHTGTQSRATTNTYLTSTEAYMYINGTYRVYNGCTYRWICVAFNDVP